MSNRETMGRETVVINALYLSDCLALLERIPTESIDLVYLDPPWPSHDEDLGQYLLFLSQRMQHVHRVLSQTGNMFLHIPPHLNGYTILLCDRIFKGENFRDQYIFPYPVRAMTHPSRPNYSLFLFYSKSRESTYNPPMRPYTEDELKLRFPHRDERGPYRLVSLLTPSNQSRYRFEWNGITPPPGQSWRYTAARLSELLEQDLISFDLSKSVPSLKYHISEGILIGSIWDDLARSVSREENTGFVAQQRVDILRRIISIGSNEGDVILDPFCGSGTALVAATIENRRWIGCDISQQAYDIAFARLREIFDTRVSIDFKTGDLSDIIQDYNQAYNMADINPRLSLWGSREKPEVEVQDVVRPLVFTEGKTDWKHLKSAFSRLKDAGYFEEDFAVDFKEYENEIKMNNAELLRMCRYYSLNQQPRKLIFVFDSDDDQTTKEVTMQGKSYKPWGSNVYSLVLPVPTHRLSTPKISIELYYLDKDIKRKDKNERRLFLSNEFNPQSGRHNRRSLNCVELNRVRGELKIIDDNVFDRQNQNVALTKNAFANYVLQGEENFKDLDIGEFTKVFTVIREIIEDC